MMLSMPVIDELVGAEYFAKLDMKFGFYQIRILPTDEFKTTFKTPMAISNPESCLLDCPMRLYPNHISVSNELYFWAIL